MRKLLTAAATCALALGTAACDKDNPAPAPTPTSTETTPAPPTQDDVDAARADYDSAKAALATAEANGLPEGSTAAIEAGAQLQTANKNLTLAEQRVADPAEADTVRAALERAAEAVAAARRAMAGVDTGPPADATGGA